MIKYSQLRWFVKSFQALLIIGIPFIQIDNKSLLSFDVPTLKLYVFGKAIWIDEFFLILISILFLTFLFILITILFGRIWCGWICPQTVLNDFADLFKPSVKKKTTLKNLIYYASKIILSVLVGANLIWYFISPYEFFMQLSKGQLGAVTTGFWVVLSILMFLNLSLLGRRFCASVCPYSKLQSIMLDQHSLVIAFDKGRHTECMRCNACVRVCPTGIDIKEGQNPSCINCAECVDTCKAITNKAGKKTLIDYRFGMGRFKPLRPQVIVFTLLTLSSLLFLLHLSMNRQMIDVLITPNESYRSVTTEGGKLINSYILSISNRTVDPLTLSISARLGDLEASVSPNVAIIEPDSHKRLPIYITLTSNYTKSDYMEFTLVSSRGETLIIKSVYIKSN